MMLSLLLMALVGLTECCHIYQLQVAWWSDGVPTCRRRAIAASRCARRVVRRGQQCLSHARDRATNPFLNIVVTLDLIYIDIYYILDSRACPSAMSQ